MENLRLSHTLEVELEPLRQQDKVQELLATPEVVKPDLLHRLADSLKLDRLQRELKGQLRLKDLLKPELSRLLLSAQLSRELNLLRRSVRLNLGHSQVALLDL